ncbi:MAG TPA: hypothetical protein VFK57_09640 [Vicinamibacterales bacterium]|nr:hypothetical protein [Vicinamibacterales bacterium]
MPTLPLREARAHGARTAAPPPIASNRADFTSFAAARRLREARA